MYMSILKHIKIEKAFNPQDIEQIDEVYFQSWLATYPNKELGILTDDIYEIFKDSRKNLDVKQNAVI